MSHEIRPTIAVVGTGPSGCYTAQFLRKSWPACEVVAFEALPTPYGLIRYGVAPDHQGTKGVTCQFDRLFERDGVRFAGNVRIGADLSFEELTGAFDVVVLATGLIDDRTMGVPEDRRARIVGAGRLLRALNGYPGLAESDGLDRGLGSKVAIVGNGNVAMDVLRLLAKDHPELHGSDVDDSVLKLLRPVPVREIDVVGRSTASNAKFDLSALREIGHLANVEVGIGETAGDEHNQVLDVLRGMVDPPVGAERVRVTFHFGLAPTQVGYDDGRSVLAASGTSDPTVLRQFSVDSIVTAIGFTEALGAAQWDAPNVWRVGWISRGARGTIPENRRDAKQVSEAIRAAVDSGELALGKPGLSAVWPQIAGRVVEFADWRRLDEYERGCAPEGRSRRKVTDLEQMLQLVTGAGDVELPVG